MVAYPGFIGASDRAAVLTVNAERTINWFPEIATGTPKARTWLVPTPGLRPFVVLGAGPVRALYSEEGRCFAVGGSHFFEIFAGGTFLYRGTVGMDSRPATIVSNGSDGQQLFIVSNGDGFIFNLQTNAFTPIAPTAPDFPTPCSMGAFVDGYFLALQAQTDRFQISALENGLSWDPLDVAIVSQTTGIVRALVPVHREVWLLGTSMTTVWADIGDADFPFAPIPGAFIQQGIGSLFGWAVVDNTLYWHGQNEAGGRVAWAAQGYTPQRISTHAVEFAWAQYPRMDDTICWSYQDRGHAFVAWYVPTAETTWVYDVTTQAWHERALWDPTNLIWTPHLARCHTFAYDKHLVGDRQSPAVYVLDPDTYTDGRIVLG
jgi:hypothetical protein